MAVLTANQLQFIYGEGTPYQKVAVSDVSFQVEQGEILGIIGHTGSGKSTLMQLLGGLMQPKSGQVLIDGVDIWKNPKEIRKYRFQVGLVFQYPEYQLFDETVEKDIGFGPRNMELSAEEIKQRVFRAAEMVELPMALLEKSPFDLSGGEKRRAAIAGVLAMEPKVLILDEPTAGLDPKGRQTILDMIRSYNEKTGAAVLFVSHNMEDIAALSHRVLVMNGARQVLLDTPGKVFAQSDLLKEMSLDVPAVTRIVLGLKEKGFPVTEGIYTVEDGIREILRLKKGGAPCAE
ncbi:MAG: energy-coupling factor transporter ATPase [Clostridia bacterium]|nr:energy-coupling factor transporter ATPase [Clostridia bacterium]